MFMLYLPYLVKYALLPIVVLYTSLKQSNLKK